jgi:hypothetical protein
VLGALLGSLAGRSLRAAPAPKGASFAPARSGPLRASAAASLDATKTLLEAVAAAGPVGVDAPTEQQELIERLAGDLSDETSGAPPVPLARIPLSGTYDLLYSAAKGSSNGKIGPFVGKVTQIIVDEKQFINQVELFGGLLTVALDAGREILDDERIRVTFQEMAFKLFGKEIMRKPLTGGGVWQMVHVDPGIDGSAKFRVMNTPSLFILRQR